MTFDASTRRPLLCDCSQAPLLHKINVEKSINVETLWGEFSSPFLETICHHLKA